MSPNPKTQRGSALVIGLVFWVVGITVALFVLSVNRSLVRSAHALEKRTRAELETLSYFDQVCFTLADVQSKDHMLVVDNSVLLPGLPSVWQPYGQAVQRDNTEIRIRYAPTGLMPQALDPNVFRRLLRILQVPEDQSAMVVAAFGDWIDADDNPRMNGAERAWYQQHRGPGVTPRNHPFLFSVAELRLLRGMDDELYRRLEPFFTVHGNSTVNINVASAELIAAILDLPLSQARALVKQREQQGALGMVDILGQLEGRTPGPGEFSFDGGTLIAVEIETHVDDTRHHLRAIIDCKSNLKAPIQILDCEP